MSRIASLKIKAKLLQKAKKKAGKTIQLKEAYEIIAKSAGYQSWREMKEHVERHADFRPSNKSLPYWNNWYNSYEQAKEHCNLQHQFLLPFESQFFVCEIDYIEALGIHKDDTDLVLAGHDWVQPKDRQALDRLVKKMLKNKNTSFIT